MNPATIALSILGGFVGLIIGGELLVRGASNLAAVNGALAGGGPPADVRRNAVGWGR
ncbi:hypothetical protein Pla108_11900 [Botrimarina colliarenosi]|uniref:Uncharacterized protein n=1 Tax=Botrimarina colliarenosi TaxID=2528001 RepID=A0A5C6AJP3_9BACT|nr:hypothetical protein [Botrimarina colliarenosi]TWU00243.1 hypothetical protein Pla108_11900 [Botrimarina colliarenosi]